MALGNESVQHGFSAFVGVDHLVLGLRSDAQAMVCILTALNIRGYLHKGHHPLQVILSSRRQIVTSDRSKFLIC